MGPIPDWLQWFGLGVGLVGGIGYFIEKALKLRRTFRTSTGDRRTRSPGHYLIGSVLALCCAVIWGLSYASLSLVHKKASDLQINIYLFGFASLFLYIASAIEEWRKKESPNIPSEPWNSGRAQFLVVLNLGNFLLSVYALTYITASHAMAFNNLSPVFLALFLWVRGKLTFSMGTFGALLLVTLGAFLVNCGEGFTLRTGNDLTGMGIAIGAGVCFALWTFFMGEIEDETRSSTARLRLLATIFFASYTVAISFGYFGDTRPALTSTEIGILALNGLRVAVVYLLFQLAIKYAGPLLATVVVVLQVPLTFPFDHWFNKAPITPTLILGATLIVLAAMGLLSDEIQQSRRNGGGARPAS